MIISHKYRFIFIKTTKTAGTSLEVYLTSLCGENDIVTPIMPYVEPHNARNYEAQGFFNHISGNEIKSKLNKSIWESYFKFCVERNPWDKTLSHYHMMNKRSKHRISFHKYFTKRKFPFDREKYTNANGEFLVDKVILYENLSSNLSSILNHLGVPFSGHLGVRAKSEYRTDRRHYREVLNHAQSNIIKEAFRQEIKWFNYEY